MQKSQQITVSLDSEGTLSVDRELIEFTELKTTVEKSLETEQTTVVVINADETVDHGLVVDVIDQLRQIPEVSLAIAAKKEQS